MYLYWSYKDRSRGSNLECRINQGESDSLKSWVKFFKGSNPDKVIDRFVDDLGRTIHVSPVGD